MRILVGGPSPRVHCDAKQIARGPDGRFILRIVVWVEVNLGRVVGAATSAIGGARRNAQRSIPFAAPAFCLAIFFAAATIPAAAEDGVLTTIDYAGGPPVEASYGNLRFVIDQVKGEYDFLYIRTRAFRRGHQVFAMQVCCNRKSATLSLLKTRHFGPAAVLQSLHGKCCADSWVALPITPSRWVVREGDYSDGDKGYRFEDLDGDGAPELIGTNSRFRLLDLTPNRESERFAPIAIRRMNGEQLVRVTADPRYRRVVADSLAALEAHPDWHDNSFLATWFATKVLLGEGQAGWARLIASYTSHLDYMCKLPMAFAPCRKEHEMIGDVPAQVRRYLLLWGYIPKEKSFLLPPGSAGPHP